MLADVEYPVELDDVVVVGYQGPRQRSFTVRPRRRGRYVLAVWPRHLASPRDLFARELVFASADDAPARVDFDADAQRRGGMAEWEWCLARVPSRLLEMRVSELLFRDDVVARGVLRLDDVVGPAETRALTWSCHQPFDTDGGGAVVGEETATCLAWYAQVLGEFEPDVVLALGDTAYSDGTESTNFADEVYDRPGWHLEPGRREWLRRAYRRMYQHHWSFPELAVSLREYPHVMTWDDHEIRDGWGSEDADQDEGNVAMFSVARSVGEEFVLGIGPRVRPDGDAHKAWISGPMACFVFDSRTSRRYADPGGRIISETQLEDLRRFHARIAADPAVSCYLLGTTVPFIYLEDALEDLVSSSPKALGDLAGGTRDDMRDSWSSPGNRDALKAVLGEIRSLLLRRPDLHVVNISGDIHVANAFELWPPGFLRPIYQVTSSALTNRSHLPELANELLAASEYDLGRELGFVRRLWPEIVEPNVLCVAVSPDRAVLTLRVMAEGEESKDRELILD